MEAFVSWLNTELDRRGWPRSEAARRGRVSESMWSKVISGYAKPGLDFCRGVSLAFEVPLEDVFRHAGILDPKTQTRAVRSRTRVVYEVNEDQVVLDLYHRLDPEDQARVRDYMERLAQVEPRIIGALDANSK